MTTYCFWDEIEDNVVREYDENNSTIASYTTEPTIYGSVLSQDRGGEVRHYHFDGCQNTTELTDENGNITDTRGYSAFGEVTASTGNTELLLQWGGGFGNWLDRLTSTVHIRHRLLKYSTSRWLSKDPLLFSMSLSDYAYSESNPILLSDPSGLLTSKELVAGITGFASQILTFRGGRRQCIRICTRIVTPPIGCICITGCVEFEVRNCCKPVTEACCVARKSVCPIIGFEIVLGLYVCSSLGGSGLSVPPFPVPQVKLLPAGKRFLSGWIGGLSSDCPSDGWRGSLCFGASAGFSTFTFGARACWEWSTGKWIIDAGLGVGTGTGIFGGGKLTYTKCGLTSRCCVPPDVG